MELDATRVENYEFDPGDEFFLDANIWLYIYGPQKPLDWKVETYSWTLGRILEARCRIFIDILVISEFINTYSRIKSKLVAPKINFKKFRKSPAFKSVGKEVTDNAKRVLNHCSRIESGFAGLRIGDLLNDYSKGDLDFNDQVITELCRLKGLRLITHDGDFRGQGIPILTANNRLLG